MSKAAGHVDSVPRSERVVRTAAGPAVAAGRPRGISERFLALLPIALLVLLGALLMWSRLVGLDASLWHDEAVSILTYHRFDTALDLKTSHVLFHLLSWPTTALLGESESVQRMWSVFPAIAAVVVGTWWAWRRLGVVAALAFAVLAVAAPMHLDLAPQARGYGLALLAATLMLITADRLTRTPSKGMAAAFLGSGLLGIWTLVFFAFAFVGQVLSLLWWPRIRRVALVVLAMVATVSLLFYLPALDSGRNPVDTWNAINSGETISIGAALLLERSLEWLVIPTATLLSGPPTADAVHNRLAGEWVDVAALGLVVAGLVVLWRRKEVGLALLLVIPPLAFNLGFSIAGMATAPRHQFPLMLHVLLLVAVGIAGLGRLVAGHRVTRTIAIAAGVLVALVLMKDVVEEKQARALPIENFKQVAEVARGTGIDTIVTDSARPEGLRYYLGDDLMELSPSGVERLLCDRSRDVVYIRHLPQPAAFLDEPPANLECARARDAPRVRVRQLARGGAIDVWIARRSTARSSSRER